ncbi:MAG: peptidylprolyl isomerase [Alphaproteobacteria bacterium]|nr:peptidylprolyl isomerase [Alphaproteobacteria bacterium]
MPSTQSTHASLSDVWRIGALFLAMIAATALSTPAAAQGAEDTVAAIVEGEELYVRDVRGAFRSLPPRAQQAGFEQVYPQLLELLIQQMVLTNRGLEAGLDQTEEAKSRLEIAKKRIVYDMYLREQVRSRVTETQLRGAYDDWLTRNPPQEQVRASHILLETEEDARKVIALIGQGRDFAGLAQEFSTGPSGPRGGDLGYFARGQMVPAFADAAFGLQPNQYTADPIQTEFGWHVIYVVDKRTTSARSFEEMRPLLMRQAEEGLAEPVSAEIAATATVERFDLNGQPIAGPAQ